MAIMHSEVLAEPSRPSQLNAFVCLAFHSVKRLDN